MAKSLQERHGLEAAKPQLESIGYSTGFSLVTRLAALKFPIADERLSMRHLCKDVWPVIFRKQADRLQIDKQGNYIIQDRAFRWMERLTAGGGESEVHDAALLHLAFPCGIIRGALDALGVPCTVTSQVSVA